MNNQRNGPMTDAMKLDEELADVLTAISVIAKRLAAKLRKTITGNTDNGDQT